jgi:hypothetical protein
LLQCSNSSHDIHLDHRPTCFVEVKPSGPGALSISKVLIVCQTYSEIGPSSIERSTPFL